MTGTLLEAVVNQQAAAYALLHRPESAGPSVIEILLGEVEEVVSIDALPIPPADADAPDEAVAAAADRPGTARHDVLVMLPYRQIAERGFEAAQDGTPLLALTVTEQGSLAVSDALALLPDGPIELTGGHFDIDDDSYAAMVRAVIDEEIGRGEGANFVLKRSFLADISDYTPAHALAFYRRLLQRESGAYWTFLVHVGDRTLVGASPERHVSLRDGRAVMNPISGTYRYPAAGPDLDGVLGFLADRKEADELYMVVDEELKMMARICPGGGRVTGPHLKQMARLAHTEYFIEGQTDREVRDILRETMFAPTVTGSPLENACQVIARREPYGRGYYSGVMALIGQDSHGVRTMDSAILIRTADIDRTGHVNIGVGATLVRHSDPRGEVAETHAKAAGLLSALESRGPQRLADHPQVRAALEARNTDISGYWLSRPTVRRRPSPDLAGREVLVIDAEDTFTSMIAAQLGSLGLRVTVRRFDEAHDAAGQELVIVGPGPGDPRDAGHPKIAHLRSVITQRLDRGLPFVAVCLSHQVLSTELGFELRRRPSPNQGVQREIDLFGADERVGFYNTFAAHSDADKVDHPVYGVVDISRDTESGEVHALRGRGFGSMQFHAESVLTQAGPRIIGDFLTEVLRSCEQ